MTDELLARRLARLRADLHRTEAGFSLVRALDEVGRSLDRLRRSCTDDDELALLLGTPRATAASYVTATVHLTEAGADPDLCHDVLRRGRERVLVELDDVERSLLAGQAPGRR